MLSTLAETSWKRSSKHLAGTRTYSSADDHQSAGCARARLYSPLPRGPRPGPGKPSPTAMFLLAPRGSTFSGQVMGLSDDGDLFGDPSGQSRRKQPTRATRYIKTNASRTLTNRCEEDLSCRATPVVLEVPAGPRQVAPGAPAPDGSLQCRSSSTRIQRGRRRRLLQEDSELAQHALGAAGRGYPPNL